MRKVTTMTTDPEVRDERLARLQSRRTAPVDQRRAVIGKILATGLTSTTVFGITAALGWSATQAADAPTNTVAPEQLVLDLSTGQLVKYVNGVAVSAQQVADPNQLVNLAPSPSGSAIPTSSVATLPANWTPPVPSSNGGPTKPSSAPLPIASPAPSPVPVEQPVTTVVDTPTSTVPELVTIPIAVPEPARSSGGGSRSGGGGGGSSSGS